MTEESRGSALTRGKVIDVLSREKWRERGEDKYMPVLSRGTERISGTVNPREENHVVSFNQRITSGSYGVTDSRIVRRRREELQPIQETEKPIRKITKIDDWRGTECREPPQAPSTGSLPVVGSWTAKTNKRVSPGDYLRLPPMRNPTIAIR